MILRTDYITTTSIRKHTSFVQNGSRFNSEFLGSTTWVVGFGENVGMSPCAIQSRPTLFLHPEFKHPKLLGAWDPRTCKYLAFISHETAIWKGNQSHLGDLLKLLTMVNNHLLTFTNWDDPPSSCIEGFRPSLLIDSTSDSCQRCSQLLDSKWFNDDCPTVNPRTLLFLETN